MSDILDIKLKKLDIAWQMARELEPRVQGPVVYIDDQIPRWVDTMVKALRELDRRFPNPRE